jgi:hypothetical protein
MDPAMMPDPSMELLYEELVSTLFDLRLVNVRPLSVCSVTDANYDGSIVLSECVSEIFESKTTSNQLCLVVAVVALVYDYLITLGMEIRYIWPARWNLLKILYLLQRYLPFFDSGVLLLWSMSSYPSFSSVTDSLSFVRTIRFESKHQFLSSKLQHQWMYDPLLTIFTSQSAHTAPIGTLTAGITLCESEFCSFMLPSHQLSMAISVILTYRVWAVQGRGSKMGVFLLLLFLACWGPTLFLTYDLFASVTCRSCIPLHPSLTN